MPVFRLNSKIVFPDPALADEDGLLAVGGDLRPERLIAAYSAGIFPWYSEEQPILWFSPDPRMVLYPPDFRLSDTLRRLLRSDRYELRIDSAFDEVLSACATTKRPGQIGTWITTEMGVAFSHLHRAGLAHSFETYRDGRLIGGLYGISLGRAFFGESMFHIERDASKFAFAHLVAFASEQGFDFIDAQQPTAHLHTLGAQEIPRNRFLGELQSAIAHPTKQGSWIQHAPASPPKTSRAPAEDSRAC